MAYQPDYRAARPGAFAPAAAGAYDAGLRAYMLNVYNWMVSGLLLTGIVAYGIAHTSLQEAFFHQVQTYRGVAIQPTGLATLAMFAPLAFVLVLSFGINRLSKGTAQALYWAFCAAMGASLTSLFVVYSDTSIARVFFITAATFGGMSLWGYTTRTDLTRMGSFLIMGLFGIVIASLVNFFLRSTGLQFLLSVVGVIVFTGLTAYDTQRIKADYVQYASAMGPDQAAKRSVYDALNLYLNFINLFLMMLRLFGTGRSSSN